MLRVWVKTSEVKNQRTRLAFYVSFTALATAVGPLAGRADVVLATSPPLFTGLAGVALARLNRAPFVLDVRDLWPAAAEALDQICGRVAGPRGEARSSAGSTAGRRRRRRDEPFCEHIDALRGGRRRRC